MKSPSPISSNDAQALGLAWSIPVLLGVYLGLGYGIGRWLGSPVAGVLVGWGVGMGAVVYEIRKVLRSGSGPGKGGAA